ncbi:MAG: glycosyltransferase family 9 protein [Acidimicrobiia bacterium]
MSRRRQLQADRGNPRLKFLDRYVGIPLVSTLALGRRLRGRRPVPADWHSIGLLVTAGIGDAVVATGVIQDIRNARPDARIVLFVTANNAAFAKLLTDPDEVIELPVRKVPTAVRMVQAEHCDVVVDLSAWRRFDALLALLSGARTTIGRRTPGQFRHLGYDIAIDHQRDHELDNDRRLVAPLGVTTAEMPRLTLPANTPSPVSEPYAIFHLWPGGANFDERSWPIESWEELARAVNERGLPVFLTGGPEDADVTERLVARWQANGIRARSIAGSSWDESLVWLAHAAGVVSVNTGVMHVAAALGAPTIALNGPTAAARWRPLGPHTRCVSSPVVPNGYLDLGFERDDRYADCMQAITVASVLTAWDDLAAEVASASS